MRYFEDLPQLVITVIYLARIEGNTFAALSAALSALILTLTLIQLVWETIWRRHREAKRAHYEAQLSVEKKDAGGGTNSAIQAQRLSQLYGDLPAGSALYVACWSPIALFACSLGFVFSLPVLYRARRRAMLTFIDT